MEEDTGTGRVDKLQAKRSNPDNDEVRGAKERSRTNYAEPTYRGRGRGQKMSSTNAILAAMGGSVQNAERAAIKPRSEPNSRFWRGTQETQDERLLTTVPWRSQDEIR